MSNRLRPDNPARPVRITEAGRRAVEMAPRCCWEAYIERMAHLVRTKPHDPVTEERRRGIDWALDKMNALPGGPCDCPNCHA